ncbi:MAG: hypothetical protein RQ801_10900, partial [Spirochaetaceae bacterium]|nr:hypothetical protein [Spirochaetaceae bacterium]
MTFLSADFSSADLVFTVEGFISSLTGSAFEVAAAAGLTSGGGTALGVFFTTTFFLTTTTFFFSGLGASSVFRCLIRVAFG